jgi:hypothetical protein
LYQPAIALSPQSEKLEPKVRDEISFLLGVKKYFLTD